MRNTVATLVLCLLIAGCGGLEPSVGPKGAPPCVSPDTRPEKFLFGASVYPELQTREEWNRMLDVFAKAKFTALRASDSSWGNLEVAPGKYNFGWLRDFLDDAHKRGMKVILGTSTYIAPQWLTTKDPEVLEQSSPGVVTHPMARKAASLNNPKYREACRRYILAMGREFKDHPAVIGWQLDNEIEFMVGRVDYSAAARRAWTEWLKKNFKTADEFNRRLLLESWGMKVGTLDEVMLPTVTVEGSRALPALTLAHLHFRRDVILEFFKEQTQALRDAGVKHWITTDWNSVWTALADDPLARESLDIASLNFYQPSLERPDYWTTLAWHFDMHRSAHGLNRFIGTETRVGVAGDVIMWDPFPTRDQFRMWMFQPVAFGSVGLIYWSGNRWRGGHWPHWGGVLDWSGRAEPDVAWLTELGGFFEKWSRQIIEQPVKARAAVLTDFDQRAALAVYKHVPASNTILPDSMDMLHRAGIGADTINVRDAADPAKLKDYALVLIPAATALEGAEITVSLKKFVEEGGRVVITPFTAYQDNDGVFRGDGFGANLAELTGAIAPTARRMGTESDAGRKDQQVKWADPTMTGLTPVGVDGYCELLEAQAGTEVVASFQSDEPLLNGRPAATRKKIGKGSVIKLAFWPKDDSVARLMRNLVPEPDAALGGILPRGLQAVPRADRSLWVINTSNKSLAFDLKKPKQDRISGKAVQGRVAIGPYGTYWLE